MPRYWKKTKSEQPMSPQIQQLQTRWQLMTSLGTEAVRTMMSATARDTRQQLVGVCMLRVRFTTITTITLPRMPTTNTMLQNFTTILTFWGYKYFKGQLFLPQQLQFMACCCGYQYTTLSEQVYYIRYLSSLSIHITVYPVER